MLSVHLLFEQRDCVIHQCGEHAEDHDRRHDEVELEHLPAVNDQIPETGL